MNPILKNILAVIAGLFVGWLVNYGLIIIGASIISPLEGVDPSDVESIKANMHLFEFKHMVFPFLAHALGTLAGAFTAAKIAANNKKTFAIVIGVFFLLGGIAMVVMVGGPLWFIILDLGVAYIPMGWLGWKLATKNETT